MISDDDKMCVCGHPAFDHHRSWFPGGGLIIEECEHYGWNQFGGAMKNDEGRWVDHCMSFRLDKEANHGSRENPEG